MDTKLNINSIEAGSITYDKLNQDVVDKFNAKADSASVTNVSNRVTAIEGLIATDSDAVIDKWDEVVTFLDGISATDDLEGILANKANTSTVNDLMTMLDGKLDKTGGTIINNKTSFPLEISSTYGLEASIRIRRGDSLKGVIGFYDTYGTMMWNETAQSRLYLPDTGGAYFGGKALLHEGNVGDYALKTDGSNIMAGNAYVAWNSGVDDNDISDWSTVTGNGLRIISSIAENSGAPVQYATALHVKGRYTFKLASRGGSVDALYYQNSNNDWKTIAFTDSDITGNAATATKLETAVSLWGNEFDGTQSLNGSISFKDGDKLRTVLDYTSNSEFHLGYGTRTLNLTIWGTPIYFYANSTRAMTITEEGNVLIGNSVTVNSAKFLVNGGTAHIHGLGSLASLGEVLDSGLTIGSAAYGISQWVTGSGQGHIQVGRFDGTATAYALNLNPLGGAVNVGEGGLNVKGVMNASAIKTPTIYIECAEDGTYGANGGEINRFNGTIHMQYASQKDITLCYGGGNVGIGVRYPQHKLDVLGDSYFDGTVYIPTGQKLTIGDAVLEYDGGLKSSHNFIGNLTGTATKVSNVLKFGSKTFDGSSEQTITATDLGVTSSTISDWGFTKNAGTVTSVATGTGLTGGTITGTGTISLDSTYQTYCTNGNAAWASYTTATSIASIPVGYKLVKCTISASGSFALASTSITAGREIHIIIYNSSSSDVVVSLPTAAPYVNFSADSLTVPANRYAEINVISDGSNLYIRTLA